MNTGTVDWNLVITCDGENTGKQTLSRGLHVGLSMQVVHPIKQEKSRVLAALSHAKQLQSLKQHLHRRQLGST